MTTSKVFIGTRFDSDRCKSLEKIAKKLHISKNAVIENAFDIYAEEVLGVLTPSDNTSDNTIKILEERIKSLELTIAKLQPKVITPSDNTSEPKVITPSDNTSDNTSETLTKAEFLAKFGFAGDALDVAYSQAAMAGKSEEGWLDSNGDRWFISGSRTNRTWTKA